MKNKISTAALAFTIVLTTMAFTTKEEKKPVKTGESKVIWKGYKVTGSHEGTIQLKEGFLTFNGEKLTGGEVIVDMTSINTTDLKGEYKDKLDGHLRSDDFFGIEKYPTAKLTLKEVKSAGKNSYNATGELTIKGKTHPVTFDISVYGSKASATLKVDRTKYDVRYGSGSFFDNLGDKTIYDEFDLVVDLQF